MTIDDVKARLLQIEEEAALSDDERAHSLEDALHRDVLEAVANGHPDSMALAELALSTLPMDFARWCA